MASQEFPCSLVLTVPFPTARLASIALQAIQVDKELSSLVRRTLSTVKSSGSSSGSSSGGGGGGVGVGDHETVKEEDKEEKALRVEYSATTNRMLRVAVNSFMDSLRLVVEVMERLDVDVIEQSKADS